MKHKRNRRGYIPLFFRYTDPATGLRRAKTVYGKTEEDAAQRKAAFLSLVDSGLRVAESGMTLRQWSATWLDLYKRPRVAANTLAGYQHHINTINAVIGDLPLRAITQAHVMTVYAALNGKSASTIHHVKTLLCAMLNAAVDNRYIAANPSQRAKPPKGASGTHRALSVQEIRAIITVAEQGHRYAAPVMLMLFCGLRRGEACAVTDADIRGDTLTVSKSVRWHGNRPAIVRPKTAAGVRQVHVPLILRDYTRFKGHSTGGNAPPTLIAFRRGFSSFMTAVGVVMNGCSKRWQPKDHQWVESNIRPHDLRHTYATILHDAGVDIKTAQRWLGHASPALTMGIYTHLTESRLAQAAQDVTAFVQSSVQSLVPSPVPSHSPKSPNKPASLPKKYRRLRGVISGLFGDPSATRTRDTLIKSQVLCQRKTSGKSTPEE